ncbi:MAG TPA: ribose-phosphate diphosphokinase [Acidimicrobiales bacterium]|nr:ribose-phosphate diphosphokinase [Acidimicrobiales bacterium]
MESLAKRRLVLVTGRCHPALAESIAEKLGVTLTEANVREFANGEIHCRFDTSIRGAHVFIIQTHATPVNVAVMEQLIMIDAAKRASAKSITAVIPNFGYARQDRKSAGREPITAKLIADMLQTAGANRVLSVDFHSGQIQGFFDIPVDHLVAAPVLEDYLKANANPRELVVVAPDAGRVKVAERYAQHLGCELALVHKTRPHHQANVAEARHIVGEVNGRHCVLIDDMIDTAGTIVAACDLLKANGAEEIWVMATHAVFSPPAVERLFNAPVSRVVVTDTLPLGPERRFEKLEILSIAPIIANAISAIFEDSSVSDIFGGENLL